jgi:hypothetical protein
MFFAYPFCVYAQTENATIANATEAAKTVAPACRQDSDCSPREGLVNRCLNAGKPEAVCAYFDVKKTSGTIITDKDCLFCSVALPQETLRSIFLGLSFNTLDYREATAQELLKKYNFDTLPAFILPLELKDDARFAKVSAIFDEKNGALLLKNNLSGIFYFIGRSEKPGATDLFVDFYNPKAWDVLNGLAKLCGENKYKLNVWFVTPARSSPEIEYAKEEKIVALAVKRVYPEKFIDYVGRRLRDIKNNTWVNTADALKFDYKKIKEAIGSKDVEADTAINDKNIKELYISEGNVILVDNKRMFKIFEFNADNARELFKKQADAGKPVRKPAGFKPKTF